MAPTILFIGETPTSRLTIREAPNNSGKAVGVVVVILIVGIITASIIFVTTRKRRKSSRNTVKATAATTIVDGGILNHPSMTPPPPSFEATEIIPPPPAYQKRDPMKPFGRGVSIFKHDRGPGGIWMAEDYGSSGCPAYSGEGVGSSGTRGNNT